MVVANQSERYIQHSHLVTKHCSLQDPTQVGGGGGGGGGRQEGEAGEGMRVSPYIDTDCVVY